MFDIVEALYYIIPAAALLFFAISLFRYQYAGYKNKRAPGTYNQSQMKLRKIFLVVSSVIVGIMMAVIVSFIILLSMAVAFM